MHESIHYKFPPPINLGGRAVGWLSSEVEAVIAAMAAGGEDYTLEQVVDSSNGEACHYVERAVRWTLNLPVVRVRHTQIVMGS